MNGATRVADDRISTTETVEDGGSPGDGSTTRMERSRGATAVLAPAVVAPAHAPPSIERPRPTTARRRSAWVRSYRNRLILGDFAAAAVAATVAFSVRMPSGLTLTPYKAHYVFASVALPFLWLAAMGLADAYDARIFGMGSEELQRTIRAFVGSLAVVGFVSYAGRVQVARGYVVIALPLAMVLSAVGRHLIRRALHRARIRGDVGTSVVAVGDAVSVVHLAERMHAESYFGMHVVGACVPRAELSDPEALALLAEAGILPLGDLDSVVTAVSRARADTVAVTSSRDIGPRRLRELSWQLEDTDADLVVSPGLVEVAGPRLHIRALTGLPLLQVEKPEFAGGRRLLKGFVDRAAAVLGLLALSPVLVVCWFAVRASSSGPALFHQTRVGKDGVEFKIFKFRSMYVDAEARRADLAQHNENADGLLFKVRRDPRVTGVGRVIRRYSLDELPQLWNVVTGTMSLVGPRPPLPSEVARYGFDVRRRLLVRPGLTGLWQVSGRSDLSWDESVRLDLRYVENWSLGQDALILWKTLSAVLRGSGAY